MYKIMLFISVFLLASALESSASDNTIKVSPGNYDITTKATSNFNPEGKIEKDQECIDKTSVGVNDFMPDEKACSTSNVNKSGNKLTFDMQCEGSNAMPAMKGKAEISATDTTLQSKYKMVGSYNGQEFSISTESTGKKTGPCK